MRVIFVPNGGFGATGGFIEVMYDAKITGEEIVYQREASLRLRLVCRDVRISHGISVIDENLLADKTERNRTSTRTISGTGVIQDARWQRHRLSFLGRKETHDEITVTIHERPEAETVYVGGLLIEADLDHEGEESFFASIAVSAERMDMLIRELQQPNAELRVSIYLSAFRNFYATWSPAIDEGRVIKFLDSDRDVENRDEIPEEFWNKDIHQKILTGENMPPISVDVVRRLPSTMTAQTASPGPQVRTSSSFLSGSQAITAASKRVSRRISILCAVVLVAAILGACR